MYYPPYYPTISFQAGENDVIVYIEFTSEQSAARALGYTQKTWDNKSGKEKMPASSEKKWKQLTEVEQKAAKVLGFTKTSWDNKSGMEKQPASSDKSWSKLTSSGDDCTAPCLPSRMVKWLKQE